MSDRKRNLCSSCLGLIVASLSLAVSTAAAAASTTPQVKIVRAADVAPLLRADSKDMKDGRSVHRRVISKPKDGAVYLDVGYNTYKAGVGADQPYAYTKDEACYISAGEIEAESDGITVIAKPGNFMWRPAGAVTHRTKVIKDAVTICAFAPARDDDWSHRLPPAKIGQWAGDEAKRPHVRFYDWRYTKPTIRPDSPQFADGRVVNRRVFTGPKDGAVHVDASYNAYKAGVESGPYVYTHDEICWLESGEIEMVNQGVKTIVRAGDFAFRPAGAATDRTKVLKDAVSICFFGPARKDDWSHRRVPTVSQRGE